MFKGLKAEWGELTETLKCGGSQRAWEDSKESENWGPSFHLCTLTFSFPFLSPDPLCRKPSKGGHLPKVAGSQGRREDHLGGAPGDSALPPSPSCQSGDPGSRLLSQVAVEALPLSGLSFLTRKMGITIAPSQRKKVIQGLGQG